MSDNTSKELKHTLYKICHVSMKWVISHQHASLHYISPVLRKVCVTGWLHTEFSLTQRMIIMEEKDRDMSLVTFCLMAQ